MNFKWQKLSEKGRLSTGLLLIFQSKTEDNNHEMMIVLHCFGKDKEVTWISVRFFFKEHLENLTDGFLFDVYDDVKNIISCECKLKVQDGLHIHFESYADIDSFSDELPFKLGVYPLN